MGCRGAASQGTRISPSPASDSSPRLLQKQLLACGVPFPEPRSLVPTFLPSEGADEMEHNGSLNTKARMAKCFPRGLNLAHEGSCGPAAPQASVSPYDTRTGRICLLRPSSLSHIPLHQIQQARGSQGLPLAWVPTSPAGVVPREEPVGL